MYYPDGVHEEVRKQCAVYLLRVIAEHKSGLEAIERSNCSGELVAAEARMDANILELKRNHHHSLDMILSKDKNDRLSFDILMDMITSFKQAEGSDNE